MEHASKPENLYIIGVTKWVPGDDPKFVHVFSGIRVVFSFTQFKDVTYRHISFSITDKEKALPHPVAAAEIARLYGFTGESDSWTPIRDGTDPRAVGWVQRLP